MCCTTDLASSTNLLG